jgi:acyl-coenzyme A synthetase/AMP-(fatty) acid ligase/biotin synthase-like enzyme
MNRHSGIRRFVVEAADFHERIRRMHQNGRRVVMVQSGEFGSARFFGRLYRMLKEAKESYPDTVFICSFGNLNRESYRKLRDIGMERYLLKFETSDPLLYSRIKPSDTLRNRLAHILALKKLGFHVSSGNITGLPGQTTESLAEDLLLLKELDIPMGSTSVFIPNDMSRYRDYPPGDLNRALNFTALLRIMNPAMLIPATSSLKLVNTDGVSLGLKAGANTVTLHDGTPRSAEANYVIYKKDRYRPRNVLFDIVRESGLTESSSSLVRCRQEETVFYKLVNRNMSRNGNAVYSEGRTFTFRDLYELTSRFSSFLVKHGIKEQGTVILALYDSIEFIVAFLSCLRLGAVVVPADPALSGAEFNGLLSFHERSRILTTGSIARRISSPASLTVAGDAGCDFFLSLVKRQPRFDAITGMDPHNTALILYTSGTTGTPKGVVHTCGHLLADNFPRYMLGMNEKDVVFSCSRIFSSFGLGNSLLFPFHSGAGVILSRGLPNPWTIRGLAGLDPTLFFAVPSLYEFLLRQKDDYRKAFRKVRFFISSGEKLAGDVAGQWEEVYGKPLLECFGSSEMCHPFISQAPRCRKPDSCGKAVRGFSVKFSGSGTMFCRGPTLFTGYYHDHALTQKRLRHGWFRSDDVGYTDREGFVFIRGRKNLVFKVSGSWVSVPDVERRLKSSGFIADAAVLVHRRGLIMHVVLHDGSLDAKEGERMVRRYCLKQFRTFEMPKEIYVVPQIPRTGSGKIDRRRLVHEKDRAAV